MADHGATYFFHISKSQGWLPLYGDRAGMPQYLSSFCPILHCLAVMIHKICVVRERKVIIFVDWPMNQWMVEMFLVNCGFSILTLRAAHKLAEREAVIDSFNDPSHYVRVLVTSLRVSGLRMRLIIGGSVSSSVPPTIAILAVPSSPSNTIITSVTVNFSSSRLNDHKT